MVQGAGQRYELDVLRQPREREQPHRLRRGAKAEEEHQGKRGTPREGGSGVLGAAGVVGRAVSYHSDTHKRAEQWSLESAPSELARGEGCWRPRQRRFGGLHFAASFPPLPELEQAPACLPDVSLPAFFYCSVVTGGLLFSSTGRERSGREQDACSTFTP